MPNIPRSTGDVINPATVSSKPMNAQDICPMNRAISEQIRASGTKI